MYHHTPPFWKENSGSGPIIGVANHHGHALRPEVEALMALDEATRLREEDPYTGGWAQIAPAWMVGMHSRFEVDLNRPRETAVYLRPEDAWGLDIWKQPPSAAIIETSLADYDAYYRALALLAEKKQHEHGRFVVLDLHSYNHRRAGPTAPPADPAENPEVNIGTGTMDRQRWGPLVDRFMHELRDFDFMGRHLDVRENVKFVGRQFPSWIHQHYPESGCAIAIEFKKFFMDEWTGELYRESYAAITEALRATLPGILEELARLGARL